MISEGRQPEICTNLCLFLFHFVFFDLRRELKCNGKILRREKVKGRCKEFYQQTSVEEWVGSRQTKVDASERTSGFSKNSKTSVLEQGQ